MRDGRHVAEVVDRVEDDTDLRAADVAARKADARDRQAERKPAEVPQQIGMRSQHQAAAGRCTGAAAAAREEPELEAERAGQLAAPGRFAPDREEAAAPSGDRTVDRRSGRKALEQRYVDEVARADQADPFVAGQLDAFEADPRMGRRSDQRRALRVRVGQCGERQQRRDAQRRRGSNSDSRTGSGGRLSVHRDHGGSRRPITLRSFGQKLSDRRVHDDRVDRLDEMAREADGRGFSDILQRASCSRTRPSVLRANRQRTYTLARPSGGNLRRLA